MKVVYLIVTASEYLQLSYNIYLKIYITDTILACFKQAFCTYTGY